MAYSVKNGKKKTHSNVPSVNVFFILAKGIEINDMLFTCEQPVSISFITSAELTSEYTYKLCLHSEGYILNLSYHEQFSREEVLPTRKTVAGLFQLFMEYIRV